MAENKFLKETSRGDKVVSLAQDGNGRNIAIVQRKRDFVVAIGYDVSDGTWAQGVYDFKDESAANEYREERYGRSEPLSANAVVNKKEGGSSRMNNEVTLQGKLVDEVELETSKNGKHFARGKLAIEQAHGEEVKTHTYPFTVFGAVAEQLADYKAGAQLEIAGQLNRDDYTNADGERRTSFSVVGREVKRPQEVGSKNAIKLSGFVQSQAEDGSLELKTSQDGKTQFVNFGLAVKRDSFHREGEPKPKAQYDTFYLTAFGEAAKQIVSGYHKGDLAEFHGSLNMGRSGISPIAASGKMIREASVVQDAQADRAAENENVQSAKSECVHTN